MADEEQSSEEEQSSSKKPIIIFAVALVAAIGASIGGTIFFLAEPDAPEEVTTVPSNKPATAIYHNMRPAFVVNYLTGAKPRYLQAELTVMSRNEAAIEAVILHMPLIRSEIVDFLTEQNFLELQTQDGKQAVRRGIVEIVNRVLATYNVTPGIESALLTNFVLQ